MWFMARYGNSRHNLAGLPCVVPLLRLSGQGQGPEHFQPDFYLADIPVAIEPPTVGLSIRPSIPMD